MKNTLLIAALAAIITIGISTPNTIHAADATAAEVPALVTDAKAILTDDAVINRLPNGDLKTTLSTEHNARLAALMLQWEALTKLDAATSFRVFYLYQNAMDRPDNSPRVKLAPVDGVDHVALVKKHYVNFFVSRYATAAEAKKIKLAKNARGNWWLNSSEAATTADEGAFRNAAKRTGDSTVLDYCMKQFLGEGRLDSNFVNWFGGYIRTMSNADAITAIKVEIRGVTSKPASTRRTAVLQDYITNLAILQKLAD